MVVPWAVHRLKWGMRQKDFRRQAVPRMDRLQRVAPRTVLPPMEVRQLLYREVCLKVRPPMGAHQRALLLVAFRMARPQKVAHPSSIRV